MAQRPALFCPFDPRNTADTILRPSARRLTHAIGDQVQRIVDTRSNLAPSPLGPLRTAGYKRRSLPYTRSPNRRTFAQMYPSVIGLLVDPSIFVIRPS